MDRKNNDRRGTPEKEKALDGPYFGAPWSLSEGGGNWKNITFATA